MTSSFSLAFLIKNLHVQGYHPIRVTVIFISDKRCYKQSVLELCRVELILLNDLCLQRYKETQKAHHIIDHKNSQSYDILMSSKAD